MALDNHDKEKLRDFLHDLNNRLNLVVMQSELAVHHLRSDERDEAEAAFKVVFETCKGTRGMVHDLYENFDLKPES